MTGFDLLAGAILLVSGLVGFARGATREVVTVSALFIGVAVSIFALRFSAPIAGHFIHTIWLARVAALVVVFVIAYLIVRLTGGAFIRGVRQTSLSGVDRFLGFAIGLARGAVVIAVVALAIRSATPRERMPHWYTHAMIYPEVSAAGRVLRGLAPKGMAFMRKAAPSVENALGGANSDAGDEASSDEQPARNQRPKQANLRLQVEKP